MGAELFKIEAAHIVENLHGQSGVVIGLPGGREGWVLAVFIIKPLEPCMLLGIAGDW